MDLPVAFCYNKRDDEKIGAKFDFREGKILENRKKKNPFKYVVEYINQLYGIKGNCSKVIIK